MVWAQYNLTDKQPAIIQATTSSMIDPDTLAAAGRGQVELPDDKLACVSVDLSAEQPVFVMPVEVEDVVAI